jgi:hypothetical protein
MWIALLVACSELPGGPGLVVPEETDGADHLGGVEAPSPWDVDVRTAELVLSAEAIAGLATTHDADVPEVRGEWRTDGDSWSVGVRLRGGAGSFRTLDGKPSLGLDFGQFVEGGAFRGVRRLMLTNMVQDGSMVGEHLAYALHEAAGGIAPRHGWVQLTINGEDYGLYGAVESVDERFLRDRFANAEGPLYAMGADLVRSEADDFRLEEGEDDAQAALLRLVAELDAARPDTLSDVLARNFDVDALLTTIAVDLVSGNPDAYVTRANNYFLYRTPESGDWTMLPWGADQAFVAQLPLGARYAGRLHADCLASSECAGRLAKRTRALLDVWESDDLHAAAVSASARIAERCAADPRAELDCAEAQAALIDFVERRPDAVRAELDALE